MSDGGKGSGRRPQLVPDEVVSNNWDTIFGKKEKKNTTTNEESPFWVVGAEYENPNDEKEVD